MFSKRMILGMAFLGATLSAQAQDNPEPRTIGGNKDSHGCYTSAGYVWSELLQKCIRTFETGHRIDPIDASVEQGLSAFVITKSATNIKKVEVFIPIEKTPIIAVQQGKTMVWKHKNYTLSKNAKGVYVLKNKAGKALYQG